MFHQTSWTPARTGLAKPARRMETKPNAGHIIYLWKDRKGGDYLFGLGHGLNKWEGSMYTSSAAATDGILI